MTTGEKMVWAAAYVHELMANGASMAAELAATAVQQMRNVAQHANLSKPAEAMLDAMTEDMSP